MTAQLHGVGEVGIHVVERYKQLHLPLIFLLSIQKSLKTSNLTPISTPTQPNPPPKLPNMSMTLEEANSTPRLPKPFPNIPDNVLQQFSMSGKVTAITGASAGIGWAVAEAIAEAGGHVALLYNSNPEAIAKGLKLAELHNVQVKAYQLEVSDPKRVEETINRIVRDFGRLDVFVANAGMAISKPLTETSVEEYRRLMEVNSMLFPLFFFSPRCWDDGEVRLRMDLTLPTFSP